MNRDLSDQLALEDVLAALWHARRAEDVGRLAHVGYSEVQRWALARRDDVLMSHARALLADCPYRDRQDFMFAIDRLIAQAEHAHVQLVSRARDRAIPVRFGPSPSNRHASSAGVS